MPVVDTLNETRGSGPVLLISSDETGLTQSLFFIIIIEP